MSLDKAIEKGLADGDFKERYNEKTKDLEYSLSVQGKQKAKRLIKKLAKTAKTDNERLLELPVWKREIIKLLEEHGFGVVLVAGSGVVKNPRRDDDTSFWFYLEFMGAKRETIQGFGTP